MAQVGEFVEWFWGLSPVAVFVLVLLVDYALVNLLMWWPEGRFLRKRYLAFSIGDSPIGLPLGFAGVAALLPEDFSVSDSWATASLVAGVGIVVVFWVLERVTNQYTHEEQMTPSKLAHTLAFGLLTMLIVPAIIPASRALSLENFDSAAQWAVIIGWGVWLAMVIIDFASGRRVPHAHKTRAMMDRLDFCPY